MMQSMFYATLKSLINDEEKMNQVIKKLAYIILVGMIGFTIVACGSSSSSSSSSDDKKKDDKTSDSDDKKKGGDGGKTDPSTPSTGYFFDSAVEGLSYDGGTTETKGVTDQDGKFKYNPAKEIKFKVGEIEISSNAFKIPADTAMGVKVEGDGSRNKIVSPLDFDEATTTELVNIVSFFQTLDDDGDASNGIQLKYLEAIKDEIKDIDFKLKPSDFAADSDVKSVIQKAYDANPLNLGKTTTVVSQVDASKHIFKTAANTLKFSHLFAGRNNKEIPFMKSGEPLIKVADTIKVAQRDQLEVGFDIAITTDAGSSVLASTTEADGVEYHTLLMANTTAINVIPVKFTFSGTAYGSHFMFDQTWNVQVSGTGSLDRTTIKTSANAPENLRVDHVKRWLAFSEEFGYKYTCTGGIASPNSDCRSPYKLGNAGTIVSVHVNKDPAGYYDTSTATTADVMHASTIAGVDLKLGVINGYLKIGTSTQATNSVKYEWTRSGIKDTFLQIAFTYISQPAPTIMATAFTSIGYQVATSMIAVSANHICIRSKQEGSGHTGYAASEAQCYPNAIPKLPGFSYEISGTTTFAPLSYAATTRAVTDSFVGSSTNGIAYGILNLNVINSDFAADVTDNTKFTKDTHYQFATTTYGLVPEIYKISSSNAVIALTGNFALAVGSSASPMRMQFLPAALTAVTTTTNLKATINLKPDFK